MQIYSVSPRLIYPGLSGDAMTLLPRISLACLSTDKVLYVNAFSDDNISGNNAVLYNGSRFDDTASSDDGILYCSFDQTAVGYN